MIPIDQGGGGYRYQPVNIEGGRLKLLLLGWDSSNVRAKKP
jgi:hypothetical protein